MPATHHLIDVLVNIRRSQTHGADPHRVEAARDGCRAAVMVADAEGRCTALGGRACRTAAQGPAMNVLDCGDHDHGRPHEPARPRRVTACSTSGEMNERAEERRLPPHTARDERRHRQLKNPWFPKHMERRPGTNELNGRPIFAKGSNWVCPELFPGHVSRRRPLRRLIDMAIAATPTSGAFVGRRHRQQRTVSSVPATAGVLYGRSSR